MPYSSLHLASPGRPSKRANAHSAQPGNRSPPSRPLQLPLHDQFLPRQPPRRMVSLLTQRRPRSITYGESPHRGQLLVHGLVRRSFARRVQTVDSHRSGLANLVARGPRPNVPRHRHTGESSGTSLQDAHIWDGAPATREVPVTASAQRRTTGNRPVTNIEFVALTASRCARSGPQVSSSSSALIRSQLGRGPSTGRTTASRRPSRNASSRSPVWVARRSR